MEATSLTLHPKFALNGLHYETTQELVVMANELVSEGDDFEVSIGKFIQSWLNDDDFVKVKTSGSTGAPKKIELKKAQMINSAKATGALFELTEGTSALLCLSASHIAGKMMLVRAMVLGWDLHIVSPEKDALTQYDNDYDFVAMVPYQLYHSIPALEKVKTLIVGGGPVSAELESRLADVSTKVFATYGMTETISHVAVRSLNGEDRSDVFQALPNVEFNLSDKGCLIISAPSINDDAIVTNDLVELISPTEFRWLGRFDNVINSGGFKIHPEGVERKLDKFIELPFIIASEKDEKLGERVIIVLENPEIQPLPDFSAVFSNLESYERPKKIYTISQFPFTDTGKIKRRDILKVLRGYK